MAAANVLQHLNCRYLFCVTLFIQIFWITFQCKGKRGNKILSSGPIWRCCCFKVAWISGIFSCLLIKLGAGLKRNYQGGFSPHPQLKMTTALEHFRSWPVNPIYLWLVSCSVQSLSSLLVQDPTLCLMCSSLTIACPNRTLSLSEGAFAQFGIQAI